MSSHSLLRYDLWCVNFAQHIYLSCAACIIFLSMHMMSSCNATADMSPTSIVPPLSAPHADGGILILLLFHNIFSCPLLLLQPPSFLRNLCLRMHLSI